MPDQENKVNMENKRNTVIRVVHNRQNPFVMLNKAALWDQNLSLKAVGLWARCMSRPDNWRFCISELVKHCKEGRRAVDAAMQELIKENYASRFEFDSKGKDGKFNSHIVEYVFFEFPATEEEKQEQEEIFKKFHRDCGFGNLRFGNLQNAQLPIKSLKEIEIIEKEITHPLPPEISPEKEQNASVLAAGADECETSSPTPKKTKPSPVFSPEVLDLGDKMLEIVKSNCSVYRPPGNLDKFHEEVALMLETDKQDPEVLLSAFQYACSDCIQRGDWKGWSRIICTNKKGKENTNPAKQFRFHLDKIHQDKRSRPERKFAPSSTPEGEAELAKHWFDGAL